MKPPAWIAQLATEDRVAYSRLSRDGEQILTQLRALQLVTLGVHKTRRLVVVIDKPGFAQWFQAAYPAPAPAPVTGQRAANIARARKSKSGLATHMAQPLLLRWFSAEPAATWAELTRRCGIIGITSDRLATLDLPQGWTLLTVENWEPFLALDYAPQTGAIIAVMIRLRRAPTPTGPVHRPEPRARWPHARRPTPAAPPRRPFRRAEASSAASRGPDRRPPRARRAGAPR